MYDTIGDINDNENFSYVTGDDAHHVFETMAVNEHTPIGVMQFDSAFVQIIDGDYGEVYAFYGSVPRLDKKLYRLR